MKTENFKNDENCEKWFIYEISDKWYITYHLSLFTVSLCVFCIFRGFFSHFTYSDMQ